MSLLHAYIDESGDRGWGGRATDCFVLAAVIIDEYEVQKLLALRDEICTDLSKPPSTVLHWAENVKAHSQRKYVSARIGETDGVTVSSVIIHKASLMGTGTGLSEHSRMYNYAVRRLLERLSWFARDSGKELIPFFAHVRRYPYERLAHYLGLLKLDQTEINWKWLRPHRIEMPKKIRLLQLADLASGAIYSAVEPDVYDNFEVAYLTNIAPRLYRRGKGSVTSYGLNFVAGRNHFATYPWWPDFVALFPE